MTLVKQYKHFSYNFISLHFISLHFTSKHLLKVMKIIHIFITYNSSLYAFFDRKKNKRQTSKIQ